MIFEISDLLLELVKMLFTHLISLLSSIAAVSAANTTYKSSFTQYGSTDTWGSGNCNVNTAACGFYVIISMLP